MVRKCGGTFAFTLEMLLMLRMNSGYEREQYTPFSSSINRGNRPRIINMEIELSISVNKNRIEFEYFIQKDNCFDKLTMKTVIRNKAQCTKYYIIITITIIIVMII